ncbi:MAG: thioredoxin family protein [Gemmatimonadetes bacterium]|nr:thioredoxin family protein [Gemmatimonadota bacterium]
MVLGVVLLAVAATLYQKNARTSLVGGYPADFDPRAPAPEEPIPASYETSAPGLPRLVALGAGRCIPCKAMAPIRIELRKEYPGALAVDYYDIWVDKEAGRHFEVWSIPTLIFFDSLGGELERREGFTAKGDILGIFSSHGIRLRKTSSP